MSWDPVHICYICNLEVDEHCRKCDACHYEPCPLPEECEEDQ